MNYLHSTFPNLKIVCAACKVSYCYLGCLVRLRFLVLRELTTSRLILDMTQRHNQDGDLNVISINLFEYHYSSMVKVSGLRTVYSGFKSA